MIVEVEHEYYGTTEVDVSRIIGICPKKQWVLFEDVHWKLSEHDFIKVAEAWRKLKA